MPDMRFVLAAAIVLLVTSSAGSALAAAPKQQGPPKATPSGFAHVRIGDTTKKVLKFLGRDFNVCTTCKPVTWVYQTGRYSPQAFVVRFEHGIVADAFPIVQLHEV